MDNILTLIRELRTKRKRIREQASDIDKHIEQLKKQHFDADEEKEFTFELLAAVLADYLTDQKITGVLRKFEVSYDRLELVLANLLTEQEIQEVIDKLKEV